MRRAVLTTLTVPLALCVAAVLWRSAGQSPGRSLTTEALQLYRANRPHDALERYRQAADLASRHDDRRLRIQALAGAAEVLATARGDLDLAERRLVEAHALARELGDAGLEAMVLRSLGDFFWYHRRQRHRPLDEHYRPALERFRQADDRRGIAEVHTRIGGVHLTHGDHEAAARHFESSRELFEELRDDVGRSDVHRYLGALFVQLERYDQGRHHYARSRELCEKAGYELGCLRVVALEAHLYLRRGLFERALETLDHWLSRGGGPTYATRNHLLTRGHALLHLGRPAEARASYERALDAAEQSSGGDPPFRAQALTMLAHTHMQTGDHALAAAALDRAEALPIAAKGWNQTVLHTLARADLADARGRPHEALRHLLAAAEIESQTFGSARSLFFQTQYRQVFDRLVSLLLADVVPRERAEELVFRFLEQMRYRSFRSLVVRLGTPVVGERARTPEEDAAVARIERLSRRFSREPLPELWHDLQQAYAALEDHVLRAELATSRYHLLADRRPVDIDELRRALDPGDALVEYVVSGDRVMALALTRDKAHSAVLPVTSSALRLKVGLFRHLVETDGRWRPLAAELGRILFAPLAPALDGVSRLVLVPMGDLHDLPFAAVEDGAGSLLAERFLLVSTPSATLWARGGQTRPPDESQREVLALGLRQAPSSSLEPLDFAEREARAVASVFGEEPLVGDAATEAALRQLASSSRRLHIAAHGRVEPHLPLHSRVHLASGGGEDGELTVREILDLDLRAELVSLGACSTGSSPSATDVDDLEVDRLGFLQALLHAGSDAVLAPLLPVADAGTAAFMSAFYERLDHLTPTEALAATRRSWLADGTPEAFADAHPRLDLRQPRYWAPFVLIATRSRLEASEPGTTSAISTDVPPLPEITGSERGRPR